MEWGQLTKGMDCTHDDILIFKRHALSIPFETEKLRIGFVPNSKKMKH